MAVMLLQVGCSLALAARRLVVPACIGHILVSQPLELFLFMRLGGALWACRMEIISPGQSSAYC